MNKQTEAVGYGGPVSAARASLRIFGASLEPSEIDKLMGQAASLSYRAGDQVSPRVPVPRKIGMWLLKAESPSTQPLAEQILALLGRVPGDEALWAHLKQQYSVDIYCVLELARENSGFELPARAITEIATRGLELQFDCYVVEHEDGDHEQQPSSP